MSRTLNDLENDGFKMVYDSDARAGYLRFPSAVDLGSINVTVEMTSNLNIDYDEDGNVVGVEFFA